MSDAELDQKLRAMSVELAESSPTAPTYEELHERAGIPVTQVPLMPQAGPDDGPRRPGFWQKTLGVLGLGVAVGGGAFALAAITEDDGADTPQAAVEEFIEAVAAEDAIGVGETLVPSERDLVLDYLDPILLELQRLDVAGSDADARDVDGLEFTADIDSLRVQESPLADAVTRVRILDGDLRFDGDYDALPVGSAVRDNSEGPLKDPEPVDLLVDVFGGQADVVTIEDGEGWHVSVFYTLAEYLRADLGLPSAGLGDGPAAVGAESPEALMAAVVDGAAAGDFATLLTLADPVEGTMLYDYWPVFQPEWADGLADALAEGPYAEVHSYETAVTGDGPERVVSLTRWDYSYTFGAPMPMDEAARTSFDGSCFTTAYGTRFDDPAFDDGYTPPPTDGCVGDTVEYEGATLMARRSGLVDVAVVERDGRWYVRPGASLIENWLAANRQVDAPENVHPFSLVWGAFPAPPSWGFLGGDPFMGVATEEMSDVGTQIPNCDPALDDDAMAACLSGMFGEQVSAADVAACRSTLGESPFGDDLEVSWELEGCILDVLYPPTPRDLFVQELMTCPGGGNPGVAEATAEEQQALVDCARALFEGDNVPEEILTGMAECLGVEPAALPSVTDAQALVTCGVEVIVGPSGAVDVVEAPPADEQTPEGVDVDDTIVVGDSNEEPATPAPVPTSIEVGEG